MQTYKADVDFKVCKACEIMHGKIYEIIYETEN